MTVNRMAAGGHISHTDRAHRGDQVIVLEDVKDQSAADAMRTIGISAGQIEVQNTREGRAFFSEHKHVGTKSL
jgi:hypothetical protein